MVEQITSLQNDTVKMARSLKTRKGRLEHGLFLVEGEKCVAEALRFSDGPHTVLIHGFHPDAEALAKERGARLLHVSRPVMEAICSVKTPQNVAALLPWPVFQRPEGDFVVALDGVADPQNVGSIIRSADAAGASGVVLGEGCADPLGPKSLRASMGSLFHLEIGIEPLPGFLAEFRKKGLVVAGDLAGEPVMPAHSCLCLVIGNEARGVSEPALALCAARYRIPIYGQAESLNAGVAAGIMLYQAKEAMLSVNKENCP